MKKKCLIAFSLCSFLGFSIPAIVQAQPSVEGAGNNQTVDLKAAQNDKAFMEWLLQSINDSKQDPLYPGDNQDVKHSKAVVNDFIVASYKFYKHEISEEQYKKIMMADPLSKKDLFQINYIIKKKPE